LEKYRSCGEYNKTETFEALSMILSAYANSDNIANAKDSAPEILLAESLEADIIFGRPSPGQRLMEDDISRRYEASIG
jgi:DNA-binding GntR family transcriptional regulator